MSLVELPPSLYKSLNHVDYSAAEQIQNMLYHEHNIEVGTMNHLYLILLIFFFFGGGEMMSCFK